VEVAEEEQEELVVEVAEEEQLVGMVVREALEVTVVELLFSIPQLQLLIPLQ